MKLIYTERRVNKGVHLKEDISRLYVTRKPRTAMSTAVIRVVSYITDNVMPRCRRTTARLILTVIRSYII